MAGELQRDVVGEFESPGGFVFGVQGWTWGEQRPSSITFFLNGTAKVSDQHGRPIKGTVRDGKPCYFDKCNHAQVIAALAEERVDWRTLTCAGWPQISYEELKKLPTLPPWPFAAEHMPSSPTGAACTCIVCSIRDPKLRQDALRAWKESSEVMEQEMRAAEVAAEKQPS